MRVLYFQHYIRVYYIPHLFEYRMVIFGGTPLPSQGLTQNVLYFVIKDLHAQATPVYTNRAISRILVGPSTQMGHSRFYHNAIEVAKNSQPTNTSLFQLPDNRTAGNVMHKENVNIKLHAHCRAKQMSQKLPRFKVSGNCNYKAHAHVHTPS